jgi:hypothetical protein
MKERVYFPLLVVNCSPKVVLIPGSVMGIGRCNSSGKTVTSNMERKMLAVGCNWSKDMGGSLTCLIYAV